MKWTPREMAAVSSSILDIHAQYLLVDLSNLLWFVYEVRMLPLPFLWYFKVIIHEIDRVAFAPRPCSFSLPVTTAVLIFSKSTQSRRIGPCL